MKKLIAFVLLFAPAVAFAQSANVNVSATINANLTITKVQDFSFGNIPTANGVDSSYVVATTGTSHNTGAAFQRGMVDVTAGIDSAFVEFDLPATVELEEVTGNVDFNPITVHLEYAYSSTDAATGVAYNSGTPVQIRDDNGIGSGIYGRLFIGGKIKKEDLVAGNVGRQFRGTLTVNANYF